MINKYIMNNKYIVALAIVLITYANGIVTTKFLNDKNVRLTSLSEENKTLKDKLYKYTGAFAPVNQILGILKFTR